MNSIWLGFLIVLVILLIFTVGAFLFAWRMLRVGAPTPTMAIDEAKKIRDTVQPSGSSDGYRRQNTGGDPGLDRGEPSWSSGPRWSGYGSRSSG